MSSSQKAFTNCSAGEGRIGCVFWVAITFLSVFLGYQILPTKMSVMQLEDHMKELAMTQPRKPSSYFEREIYLKAKRLDLDVPRNQIKVKKYPDRVIMEVRFTKTIEILAFEYDWDFKISLDRDLFLI